MASTKRKWLEDLTSANKALGFIVIGTFRKVHKGSHITHRFME